jgi:hypothetical protein
MASAGHKLLSLSRSQPLEYNTNISMAHNGCQAPMHKLCFVHKNMNLCILNWAVKLFILSLILCMFIMDYYMNQFKTSSIFDVVYVTVNLDICLATSIHRWIFLDPLDKKWMPRTFLIKISFLNIRKNIKNINKSSL